jgi:uncharacterized protein with beta-barrel porin domain
MGFQENSLKNDEGAKAQFQTKSIRFGVQADYDGGMLKPFVGLQGGYVTNPKITEKIDGEASGIIVEDDYFRLSALAGVKVEDDNARSTLKWFGKVYFGTLLAGDKPEYKVKPISEFGLSYTATGSQEQSLFLGIGAGFDYALSKNISLTLGMDMNFAGQGTSYFANAGVSYKFTTKRKVKIKSTATKIVSQKKVVRKRK